MRSPRLLALAALLAGTGLAPSPCTAQLPSAASGTGVSFQLFRFGDPDAAQIRSLSLLSAPFAARTEIAGRLRLELSGAYARATMERNDGTDARISGLTDTQLRVSVPVAGDLLTLTGVVLLPTGLETLDRPEAEIAGAIASDLLPFRISNWGSGGGGGMGALFTHSFGALGIGGGASYIVSRHFSPLENSELATYRPGDQLSLQLAANRNLGRSGRASLQLVYLHQSDDELRGNNLFRSGDRYQAIGSYAFRAGRTGSGIVYLGGQHRERGAALLQLTRDAPAQTMLLLGGGLRRPWRDGVFSPATELRLLRSQDGVGQGYLASVGSTAEWPVGRLRAGPLLRVHSGRVLVREGAESGFVGGEAGVTIHF